MENSPNEKYILENGWTIEIIDNKYVLEVFPIENTVFRENKRLQIPIEIFNDVKKGEKRISELFKKHKLHELLIDWKEPERKYPKQNTEIKYYGNGFIAERERGKYFLDYQLARHGGGSKRIEISKDLYTKIRKDKTSLHEIKNLLNL